MLAECAGSVLMHTEESIFMPDKEQADKEQVMCTCGLILVMCIHRLRGDIVQYDITDPENPKLAGRVWLGGCCWKGGPYKVWCCPLTCRQ